MKSLQGQSGDLHKLSISLKGLASTAVLLRFFFLNWTHVLPRACDTLKIEASAPLNIFFL